MSVDVEQIRNNARALIQQSRDLANKSKVAIERARTLSNSARLMREEMKSKPAQKRPRA